MEGIKVDAVKCMMTAGSIMEGVAI